MKCYECKFFWNYPPDWTSPHGEVACMAEENNPKDLYDSTAEDVQDCADYVQREGRKL